MWLRYGALRCVTVRYAEALRLCVTVRYGYVTVGYGALRLCVTLRYGALRCVTAVRYGALRGALWCVSGLCY